MKSIIRCFAALMLCGASVVLADSSTRESNSPDLLSLQNPSVVTQFLGRVDAVVRMLNGEEDIDVVRAMSVAQQIEARTELDLVKETEGKTRVFNSAARSNAARELLSPARYLALENACIGQLESSNEVVRILSMRVLAQSLGSHKGKHHMEGLLKKGLKALQGDGEVTISPNELFAIAESLAYLNNHNGVEVLESALRSDGSPSFLKRRAIKALDYLGIPLSGRIESDLLLSDDAAVAYTAFDSIGSQTTNSVVVSAAIRQLQNLKTDYVNKQMLSRNQCTLLVKISTILVIASREGVLSKDQRDGIKTTVNFLADVQDENVQGRIGSLFAELANDEDSELISRLLKSDSTRVRSRAALALSQCSSKTIRSQKEVLIGLLDDSSADVRNFALYAVRRGLGEKAGNYLSDAEFRTQKAKVLENYRKKE